LWPPHYLKVALPAGAFTDRFMPRPSTAGRFHGPLRGADGRPLVIPGVQGLLPATASPGGSDAVRLSAGPNPVARGRIGVAGPRSY
jgi:hypothetical protein